MDVKTGGVLGMVSYPNYDLNNYSEVSDARLKAAIEDGSASLADQQLRQWRNKALNDTYEPGSTFKILTLSAALEEGVVDMSSTFECSGSITVMGQTIHCSNTSGHGHQTLKEATGNSCNPAFINCGLGLGTDTFYSICAPSACWKAPASIWPVRPPASSWPRATFPSWIWPAMPSARTLT